MRTAIVSTTSRAPYAGSVPLPLTCARRSAGADGIGGVELVAILNEPSSPQRRGRCSGRLRSPFGRLRPDGPAAGAARRRRRAASARIRDLRAGRDGEYVLSFARDLAQPLVVTLHTVLSEPTPHQAAGLEAELYAEAELVIVMTETALRLLVDGAAAVRRRRCESCRTAPHGADRRARAARSSAAPRLRRGPFQLSTFGLISSGKGLETAIEAFPAILEHRPDLSYVIAGRTHPDVARREGERYRLTLERRVLELRPRRPCRVRRPVPHARRAVGSAPRGPSVFVTPYRNREQIASGALTFALAAGCAVVSTPYWYAQDMLGSGAGTIVPFADSEALAEAVCGYLEQPETLGRGAGRGPADRRLARVALRRQSNGRGHARGAWNRPAPPSGRGRRPASDERAPRPRVHARRRRRDHPACARDHPRTRAVTVHRRRGATGSGRTRICTAAATNRSGPRSSTDRLPSCSMPPVRAGCATS